MGQSNRMRILHHIQNIEVRFVRSNLTCDELAIFSLSLLSNFARTNLVVKFEGFSLESGSKLKQVVFMKCLKTMERSLTPKLMQKSHQFSRPYEVKRILTRRIDESIENMFFFLN